MNRFQEEAVWNSGKFSVDPCGRVYRASKRAERMTAGYLQVRVMVGGVRYHTCAHRLVWRALRGQIPAGMVVNHINGKKDDNRPENLEIVSPSENCRHAYREGLRDQRGERNPAAKLTDRQVAEIRLRYSIGGVTQNELGSAYGVSFKTISKIVRGERRVSQLGATADYTARRAPGVVVRDASGRFLKRKVAA